MLGPEDQLLQVEGAVPEAAFRLGPGGFKGGGQLLGPVGPAHPPAAPSGRGLQQDGIAHLLGQSLGLAEVFQGSV